MKRIAITVKRPGFAPLRLTGRYRSTTAAIIAMLTCMPDDVCSISAKVVMP